MKALTLLFVLSFSVTATPTTPLAITPPEPVVTEDPSSSEPTTPPPAEADDQLLKCHLVQEYC